MIAIYCLNPSYLGTISVSFAMIALVLNTPLYFFLFMYLDNIFPNTFGISKSCCFCLQRRRKDRTGSQEDDNGTTLNANFEKEQINFNAKVKPFYNVLGSHSN